MVTLKTPIMEGLSQNPKNCAGIQSPRTNPAVCSEVENDVIRPNESILVGNESERDNVLVGDDSKTSTLRVTNVTEDSHVSPSSPAELNLVLLPGQHEEFTMRGQGPTIRNRKGPKIDDPHIARCLAAGQIVGEYAGNKIQSGIRLVGRTARGMKGYIVEHGKKTVNIDDLPDQDLLTEQELRVDAREDAVLPEEIHASEEEPHFVEMPSTHQGAPQPVDYTTWWSSVCSFVTNAFIMLKSLPVGSINFRWLTQLFAFFGFEFDKRYKMAYDLLLPILRWAFSLMVNNYQMLSVTGKLDVLIAWAPIYNAYDADVNPLPFNWDQSDYEREVQAVCNELRSNYVKYAKELERLLENPVLNRLYRPVAKLQPYCVTFQGAAGMGKSSAMELTMHALHPIAYPLGSGVDQNKVSNLKCNGKFDNTTTATTEVVVFNDAAFTDREEVGYDFLETIQRVNDNIAEEIPKADVASKGKNFYNNRLTFITTNNPNIVDQKSTDPAAFYRRTGFKIEVSCQEKYMTNKRIDTSKVIADGVDGFLGVNLFTVKQFEAGELKKSVTWKTVTWEKDGEAILLENVDYDVLLPFLMQDAEKHFASQKFMMDQRVKQRSALCPAYGKAPHDNIMAEKCTMCIRSHPIGSSGLQAHSGEDDQTLLNSLYASAWEGANRLFETLHEQYIKVKGPAKQAIDASARKSFNFLYSGWNLAKTTWMFCSSPQFLLQVGGCFFTVPEMISYYIVFKYGVYVYTALAATFMMTYVALVLQAFTLAGIIGFFFICLVIIHYCAENVKSKVRWTIGMMAALAGGYWAVNKLANSQFGQGGIFSNAWWNPNGEAYLNSLRNVPAATLFNRYKKNTCIIKLPGSRKGTTMVSHAFGVRGGVLIIHRHFTDQLSETNKAEMWRDGVKYDITIEKHAILDIGLNDLVGLVIDNLHPFADMVADFPDERMAAGGGIMVGCSFDPYHFGEPVMYPTSSVTYEMSNYGLPTGGRSANLPGYGYSMSENTRVGMCASPIICTNRNQSYIYGLHSAGKGKTGYCLAVTKSQVQALIDMANQKFPGICAPRARHVDLGTGALPFTEDKTAKYAAESGIELNARSPSAFADYPDLSRRDNMRTKVSAYAAEIGQIFDYPIDKFKPVDGKRHALFQQHLYNCGKGSTIPYAEVDAAAQDFADKLNKYVDFSEIHPINLDENLNGYTFGESKVPGINMATAAGRLLGGKKVSHMDVSIGENGRVSYSLQAEKMEQFQEFRTQLRNGYLDPKWSVFRLTIKDEARTKKEGRIFAAGGMFLVLAMREYFSTIAECLSRNPRYAESCVGIATQGPAWDEVYSYLAEKGVNRCQDGDFSKFDTSFSTCLVSRAVRIMIDIARDSGNYTEPDLVAMQTIAQALVHPIAQGDGHFRYYSGFGPSGHSLTVIVNNLINSIYIRCMYRRIVDYERFPFDEHVNFVAYGDDNAFSISEEVDVFHHERISEEFERNGIKYTSASKDGKTYRLKSISECSFLKRKWVHNKDLVVGKNAGMDCPLEFDSIMKSLMITKPSQVSYEEQISQTLRSADYEFSYYGEQAYEEYTGKLLAVANMLRSKGENIVWEPTGYHHILNERIAARRAHFGAN